MPNFVEQKVEEKEGGEGEEGREGEEGEGKKEEEGERVKMINWVKMKRLGSIFQYVLKSQVPFSSFLFSQSFLPLALCLKPPLIFFFFYQEFPYNIEPDYELLSLLKNCLTIDEKTAYAISKELEPPASSLASSAPPPSTSSKKEKKKEREREKREEKEREKREREREKEKEKEREREKEKKVKAKAKEKEKEKEKRKEAETETWTETETETETEGARGTGGEVGGEEGDLVESCEYCHVSESMVEAALEVRVVVVVVLRLLLFCFERVGYYIPSHLFFLSFLGSNRSLLPLFPLTFSSTPPLLYSLASLASRGGERGGRRGGRDEERKSG